MLQRLPIDTQKEIITFLDGFSVLNLAQVNRHFRDLIAKHENLQAGITWYLLSKHMPSSFSNSLSQVNNLEDWLKHHLFSHTTSTKSLQILKQRMQRKYTDHPPSERRKHIMKSV